MLTRQYAALLCSLLSLLHLSTSLHLFHLLRWEWFHLWFELALLLALFVTCFLESAFKRGRISLLAFFVLATQGLMWSAHNFLTQMEIATVNVRDLSQDAVNAGEAGGRADT